MADALALAFEVADELVVRSARDTHRAISDRIHGVVSAFTLGAARGPQLVQNGIAGGIYAGVGLGLRTAARGADAIARTGRGPRIEDHVAGRHVRAAVNGLIGDRLAAEQRNLAIAMAPRVAGQDVGLTSGALGTAYPAATGRIAVFLHGLGESEETWRLGRAERGTTYAEELAADGWTPVLLRMNTGLGLRPNGIALASLLEDLVAGWPSDVERIALIGHSMGGLVIRAATAVAGAPRWTRLVSDVVTLGTPHRGAPLAELVGNGSSVLGLLADTAAFSRVLEHRSVGIRDLVEGLGHEAPVLPHARYRLVHGTFTASPRHPVGVVLGDLFVREASAYGRGAQSWDDLFADTPVTKLHVGGAGHFALLNHPTVAMRLRGWLAESAVGEQSPDRRGSVGFSG